MAIFVAIDAGGTKTQCWIADETRVLAEGSCGTVKLANAGEALAAERLHTLLRTTAAEAGVALNQVERTCIGLAGIASESVRAWTEAAIRNVVSGEVLLCGDEKIALEGAFRKGPGILVVGGTGSNVMGRCSDGTVVSVGGWGPVLGDEGSGYWIGLEAVCSALRTRDRGTHGSGENASRLLLAVQEFWELENIGELVAKCNDLSRANFGSLAQVVADCANKNDAIALQVLERAGEALAEQVLLVIAKMKAVPCAPDDTTKIAFTGSVLEMIPLVRQAMVQRLAQAAPESRVMEKAVIALEGALWMARTAR